LPLPEATSSRSATELMSWVAVANPDSSPRWCRGAISGKSAAYGSTAVLKKIENRKISTASCTRLDAEPAARKNSADNGMATRMKGRRRPSRVQVRSDRAPTVG